MAAKPTLEFFYDCSSPWTYFAFTRIIPMMEQLALPIRWRPILVGGVFNAVNQEVYTAREAMFSSSGSPRLNYYIKDMQDWARLCGVRAEMPEGHPINSVKAMRGAFYAEQQGLMVPYSRAVFEAYWGSESPNIADDEVLSAFARAWAWTPRASSAPLPISITKTYCARTPTNLSHGAATVLRPCLSMAMTCILEMIA